MLHFTMISETTILIRIGNYDTVDKLKLNLKVEGFIENFSLGQLVIYALTN